MSCLFSCITSPIALVPEHRGKQNRLFASLHVHQHTQFVCNAFHLRRRICLPSHPRRLLSLFSRFAHSGRTAKSASNLYEWWHASVLSRNVRGRSASDRHSRGSDQLPAKPERRQLHRKLVSHVSMVVVTRCSYLLPSLAGEHRLRWSEHMLSGYGLGKTNQLIDDKIVLIGL